MRTPTEELWPGVSELPDYKATFPKWNEFNLEQQVSRLPKDGIDLLKRLLTYNPSDRISAKAAVAHPFFDDVESKCPQPLDTA